MGKKYITNTTKIAYQFGNGSTISRKGYLIADEKLMKELNDDFYFKGLVERGALLVSENKPENLEDTAAKLAQAEAQVEALKKELSKANKKIDEMVATSDDSGGVVIDGTEKKEETPKKGK